MVVGYTRPPPAGKYRIEKAVQNAGLQTPDNVLKPLDAVDT